MMTATTVRAVILGCLILASITVLYARRWCNSLLAIFKMEGLPRGPWWTMTVLVASSVTTSLPLFDAAGPQVDDVRAVLTSTGWFEILTTGMVMTSADLLTANMTDINDTHAEVSLWKPAAALSPSSSSSLTFSPEAITTTITKRPWSLESLSAWPAALYDVFNDLYATSLALNAMTNANAATLNASQLFYAVYGRAVMAECATNITNQLLLVEHNTDNGPVVEAVTHSDILNDTVQHVQQVSGYVEVADSQRSGWWADCIFLFRQG